MYLNETITNFLTLRSQGLSYDKIAKELNVSKHTLLGWAKEYRPPIDQKLQSALETYHAALVHRAEALAKQFQTITQALTTCNPESSRYPRLVGLLLKLHKTLQEFDFNPGALSEDSTKTAPNHDSEPARTETAPPAEDDRQKLQRLNALLRTISAPTSSLRTKTAPESESSLSNSCNSSSSSLKNVLLERMRKRLDRLEAKIAS